MYVLTEDLEKLKIKQVFGQNLIKAVCFLLPKARTMSSPKRSPSKYLFKKPMEK